MWSVGRTCSQAARPMTLTADMVDLDRGEDVDDGEGDDDASRRDGSCFRPARPKSLCASMNPWQVVDGGAYSVP